MAQAGSSSSGADHASLRVERLREVAMRALDETAAGCTPDEFVEGFPSLSSTHGDILRHVCVEAQGQLRQNAMVRDARPSGRLGTLLPSHRLLPPLDHRTQRRLRRSLKHCVFGLCLLRVCVPFCRRSLTRSSRKWESARASSASTR